MSTIVCPALFSWSTSPYTCHVHTMLLNSLQCHDANDLKSFALLPVLSCSARQPLARLS